MVPGTVLDPKVGPQGAQKNKDPPPPLPVAYIPVGAGQGAEDRR